MRKCLDHAGSRALFVITRWVWRLLSSISDSLHPVDEWVSEQGVQNSINITRKLAVRVNSWDHPMSTNYSSLGHIPTQYCVSLIPTAQSRPPAEPAHSVFTNLTQAGGGQALPSWVLGSSSWESLQLQECLSGSA